MDVESVSPLLPARQGGPPRLVDGAAGVARSRAALTRAPPLPSSPPPLPPPPPQPHTPHTLTQGGFTRLLACGVPDGVMDEVPTVVVGPPPPRWRRLATHYNPGLLPWALGEWLAHHTIEEDFVYLCEPDQILVHPPPLLATRSQPAAWRWDYMRPQEHAATLQRFNARNRSIDDIPPSGARAAWRWEKRGGLWGRGAAAVTHMHACCARRADPAHDAHGAVSQGGARVGRHLRAPAGRPRGDEGAGLDCCHVLLPHGGVAGGRGPHPPALCSGAAGGAPLDGAAGHRGGRALLCAPLHVCAGGWACWAAGLLRRDCACCADRPRQRCRR